MLKWQQSYCTEKAFRIAFPKWTQKYLKKYMDPGLIFLEGAGWEATHQVESVTDSAKAVIDLFHCSKHNQSPFLCWMYWKVNKQSLLVLIGKKPTMNYICKRLLTDFTSNKLKLSNKLVTIFSLKVSTLI